MFQNIFNVMNAAENALSRREEKTQVRNDNSYDEAHAYVTEHLLEMLNDSEREEALQQTDMLDFRDNYLFVENMDRDFLKAYQKAVRLVYREYWFETKLVERMEKMEELG